MDEAETSKTRAASALGITRSTAASTLSLRSFEYGFTPAAPHASLVLSIPRHRNLRSERKRTLRPRLARKPHDLSSALASRPLGLLGGLDPRVHHAPVLLEPSFGALDLVVGLRNLVHERVELVLGERVLVHERVGGRVVGFEVAVDHGGDLGGTVAEALRHLRRPPAARSGLR